MVLSLPACMCQLSYRYLDLQHVIRHYTPTSKDSTAKLGWVTSHWCRPLWPQKPMWHWRSCLSQNVSMKNTFISFKWYSYISFSVPVCLVCVCRLKNALWRHVVDLAAGVAVMIWLSQDGRTGLLAENMMTWAQVRNISLKSSSQSHHCNSEGCHCKGMQSKLKKVY